MFVLFNVPILHNFSVVTNFFLWEACKTYASSTLRLPMFLTQKMSWNSPEILKNLCPQFCITSGTLGFGATSRPSQQQLGFLYVMRLLLCNCLLFRNQVQMKCFVNGYWLLVTGTSFLCLFSYHWSVKNIRHSTPQTPRQTRTVIFASPLPAVVSSFRVIWPHQITYRYEKSLTNVTWPIMVILLLDTMRCFNVCLSWSKNAELSNKRRLYRL